MVSARLLLANGTIIEASDDKNPDLFWALRGAGHNFGIVLEATYKVYPQLNEGRHFVVDFEFELDKVEDIFEAVNAISNPMPKEVAVFVIGRRLGANGKVSSLLTYHCSRKLLIAFSRRSMLIWCILALSKKQPLS